VTIKICAPISYKRWDGKRGLSKDQTVWPYPTMKLEEETWWTEHLTDDPFWAPMGYCPRGVGRWQRFWRHWHHGRLMRYPRISVLVFCVRDTKPKHKVKP